MNFVILSYMYHISRSAVTVHAIYTIVGRTDIPDIQAGRVKISLYIKKKSQIDLRACMNFVILSYMYHI
eukprot:COSAG05_NODE_2581_length_2876_cov_7.356860_2_plen_69_part_00